MFLLLLVAAGIYFILGEFTDYTIRPGTHPRLYRHSHEQYLPNTGEPVLLLLYFQNHSLSQPTRPTHPGDHDRYFGHLTFLARGTKLFWATAGSRNPYVGLPGRIFCLCLLGRGV